MNNEYYESLGMIYESYEEGLISEDTKNGLINKIKDHLGPSRKEIKKTHNDKVKAANKLNISKRLSNALWEDWVERADKRDKPDYVSNEPFEKEYNRTFRTGLRAEKLVKKARKDFENKAIDDYINKDLNPERYKKALKKK